MEMEAAAGTCPAPMPSVLHRIGALLGAVTIRAAIVMVLLAAWLVRQGGIYTSASDFGYWLGVAGGSLMLVLLIYPLRKRFRWLAVLGPLKHWFRFHLVAGIAGPLVVLFHSTFRVGSFNAAVALGCMLLVVASGLVGRYIYRKIHHGLYGSRATADGLRRELAQQMEALQPLLLRLPAVEREIADFYELTSHEPASRWRRAVNFAMLGWRRRVAGRRIRRAIERYDEESGGEITSTGARLLELDRTISSTLHAVQRSAQFATYEKLFSLWHVVHIPFLCLLVITAIVHVVAVHAY